MQIEQPIRMVSAIQHMTLVMIKTEAGELTYQLREIISQLKTEGDAS